MRAFRVSVDDYLAFCKKLGRSPERPYSGRFNVRINPALYRRLATIAESRKTSLNAIVEEALTAAVGGSS
jgi:predicted HicB family RNase H-like nuclease